MPKQTFDIAIIGGGIVGLSTAMHLARDLPSARLLVLEKEPSVAQHQSGHNSGVIHSGVYYKPNSLKARLCVEGAAAMVSFCRDHGLPHEVCGKVIVTTSDEEIPRLKNLLENGNTNGLVGLELIGSEKLREIEPHSGGVAALHVPMTGIADYAAVARKYAQIFIDSGGELKLEAEVLGFGKDGHYTVIETAKGEWTTRHVINCAGLHSDRVSRLAGQTPEVVIVPFRGEYYDLVPERHSLVRSLIYPVPDPRFPFLGVHFTRRVHGGVDAGPNAVLAFKREGYHRTDFELSDTVEMMRSSGFRRLAMEHWRHGAGEIYRSFSKAAFVRALQRLVPEIREDDLREGGSGVRAQAIRADGSMVDDFQFLFAESMLHVYNVPSPAATASLPIGRTIANMAAERFQLAR